MVDFKSPKIYTLSLKRGELERLATTKKIAKKLRVSTEIFLQKKTLCLFGAEFFKFERWSLVFGLCQNPKPKTQNQK
ncbi:MAG: hypothetical protein WA584_03025 [Pyrinomonadaceae bacterium]